MELLRYGSPLQEAFINGALFIMTKINSDVLPPFATECHEYLVILQTIVSFFTCSLLKMNFSSGGIPTG